MYHGATFGKGRAKRDVLLQPSTLADTVQGGKWETAVDCCGLHGVAEKWSDPIGHLSRHDEGPSDRTGQAAKDHAGRHQRNLEIADGKVPASGHRAKGKGRLRD